MALDVLWATAGGLAIGGNLGDLVGRLVLYLRGEHKEAVGTDDFLALGLIAFSYGSALLIGAYGFLAVFAAGIALRRIERYHSEASADETKDMPLTGEADEIATDPQRAPAYMAQAVLQFNEHLERIGEVAIVILVGAMLSAHFLSFEALWFVLLLLFVARPVSVWLGLLGSSTSITQRNLIGWFGIRGIGSIYYKILWTFPHTPNLRHESALQNWKNVSICHSLLNRGEFAGKPLRAASSSASKLQSRVYPQGYSLL